MPTTDTIRTGTRCASCGATATLLDLRCTSCGAYLRDRVPALDLFGTAWAMVDRPAAAFLRVARSEQKNYTWLLGAAAGPVYLTIALLLARARIEGTPFATIFFTIALAGPLLGALMLFALTAVLRAALRHDGGPHPFRLAAAFLAWAQMPLAAASVILLPVIFGVFGADLFASDPGPWETDPVPFWTLAVLCAATLYSAAVLGRRALRVWGMRPAFARRAAIAAAGTVFLFLVAAAIAAALVLAPAGALSVHP